MTKKLNYVPSCNRLIFFCFLWVPIRFLMNPITKLGTSVEGGKGVSGANAYFGYALAAILIVTLGCVLNTRKKVIDTLRWAFRVCFIVGVGLLICAFIPASQPYLSMFGVPVSNYSPGVLRILSLPVFGMFIVGAGLCPRLFRIKPILAIVFFMLGMGMIIISGDRGSVASILIFIPMVLFAQKRYLSIAAFSLSAFISIAALHEVSNLMDVSQVPGIGRIAGLVSTKAAEDSGGNASAEWRYEVWNKGVSLIMEAPLTGKGYGHLSKQLNPEEVDIFTSDNYEAVLAAGAAHNGYVSAAYGFGIPFVVGILLALLYRMCIHMITGMHTYGKDTELCQFHALMAGYLFSYVVGFYTYAELSTAIVWFIVGAGIIMDHVTRAPKKEISPVSISTKTPDSFVPASA